MENENSESESNGEDNDEDENGFIEGVDDDDLDSEDDAEEYPIVFGEEDDGMVFQHPAQPRPIGFRAASGSRFGRTSRRNYLSDVDGRLEIGVEGTGGTITRIIDDNSRFSIAGRSVRGGILSDSNISHPLLVNQHSASNARLEGGLQSAVTRGLDLGSFDDLLGGHAMQLLEEVFRGAINSRTGGNATLRLEIPSVNLTNQNQLSMREVPVVSTALTSPDSGIELIYSLSIQQTVERWTQEAKMSHGNALNEKCSRLLNAVLNALVPAALEEDRKRLAKEEEARIIMEDLKKKKAELDSEALRIKEEADKVFEEAKKLEEIQLAQELADQRALSGEDVTMEDLQEVGNASSSAAIIEVSPPTLDVPARLFVSINGVQVDVTDSGIDVEFLEALPDDLRQEVLDQHIREQRRLNLPAPASLSINNDFLDALPPDIRDEIIQQERAEVARRNREEARASGESGGLDEIDPNSFLTALDPALRQTVLSEQDPAFLSTLSPMLMAEANALRERMGLNRPARRVMALSGNATGSSSAIQAKRNLNRDAIQLVDKSAVMSLLRLLFVPEPVSKTLVHRLLVNISENSRTRGELLTLVMCILSEGCSDLSAVDKTFSGNTRMKTLKSSGIEKGNFNYNNAGNIPNLVELRCLEIVSQLINANENSVAWFICENDTLFLQIAMAGKTPKSSSRKGKGKASGSSNGKCPLILLLGLLDRPSFLSNSTLMEQLMFLLSVILKPTVKKDNRMPIEAPSEGASAGKTLLPTTSTSESTMKESEVVSAPPTDKPKAPRVSDNHVRLVVHVLTGSDCPNRTFGYTMSVVQHLLSVESYENIVVEELVASVHELGIQILPDMTQLLDIIIASKSKTDVNSSVLSSFSRPSSTQSKLLRVLKTLDFIYSKHFAKSTAATLETAIVPPNGDLPVIESSEKENSIEKSEVEKVPVDQRNLRSIYDTFDLTNVWDALGKCLATITAKSDLINVGTVLLPLIESFLVVSKPYILAHSLANVADTFTNQQSTASNEELFVAFTEEHRKILNTMVRNNTSLMSGSFSLLVQNPKVLDFDNKRTFFNHQLHKRTAREHYGSLQLNVRRAFVFEDSYQQLQGRTGPEIKYGKLVVRFYEEEGVDAGGVTREWFSVLARQLFNPNYALFKPSAVDKITYQPNRSSWINPDHLFYFKFVGRIIGKAIYDNKLLDCYFTRSFYKFMLDAGADWKDMEAVDPEYHKSLEWLLNNDITDVLDLTFSCEVDDFGNTKTVDLIPNGASVVVTEGNKIEYVKLITEQKLQVAIKDQIKAFLDGFHDIIPKELIKIFNEQELELLISGLPDIDVEDWKSNTEYQNYTATSVQVQWFWRVVRSFTQEERAKLIQFVTGTSKVPLEGFCNLQGSNGIQKFQIHKEFSSTSRLPSAHTCFNQMDLPEYETYEQLRTNLLMAMNEGATGFGFA